jgi:hypothetical protein
VSRFDSISVQPPWSLYSKIVRLCFSNRVFRQRQRRLLTLLAGNRRNSFRVGTEQGRLFSQGFKANPGLKLANAVGVKAGWPTAVKTYQEER